MKIAKDAEAHAHEASSRMVQTKPRKGTAAEVGPSDRVELPNQNRAETILGRIKEMPLIRGDKVDRIKSAIENGQYNVNARQVIKSILKNNLLDELL